MDILDSSILMLQIINIEIFIFKTYVHKSVFHDIELFLEHVIAVHIRCNKESKFKEERALYTFYMEGGINICLTSSGQQKFAVTVQSFNMLSYYLILRNQNMTRLQ
jgi:hypothetical protein